MPSRGLESWAGRMRLPGLVRREPGSGQTRTIPGLRCGCVAQGCVACSTCHVPGLLAMAWDPRHLLGHRRTRVGMVRGRGGQDEETQWRHLPGLPKPSLDLVLLPPGDSSLDRLAGPIGPVDATNAHFLYFFLPLRLFFSPQPDAKLTFFFFTTLTEKDKRHGFITLQLLIFKNVFIDCREEGGDCNLLCVAWPGMEPTTLA